MIRSSTREPNTIFIRARRNTKVQLLDFDEFLLETGRGIVAFFAYIRELWSRRALIRVLVGRELKSSYEMSVVGFSWWLLEPLSMSFVYVVLINILTQRGASDKTLVLSILVAVLPFKWLRQSLVGSMGVVRSNASLVNDVYFPRALLPVTQLITGLAHLGVGLAILPVFMIFTGVTPSWHLLWLPVVIAVQFVLMLGLSYPLSVWGLIYKNMPTLLGNLLRLWFYVSPGLWTLDRITSERLRFLLKFNPLTGIFEGYRGAIVTHHAPDWSLLVPIVVGVVSIMFGGWYFTRREPHFGKML